MNKLHSDFIYSTTLGCKNSGIYSDPIELEKNMKSRKLAN